MVEAPLARGCCAQRIKRTAGSHRGVQHPRAKGAWPAKKRTLRTKGALFIAAIAAPTADSRGMSQNEPSRPMPVQTDSDFMGQQ